MRNHFTKAMLILFIFLSSCGSSKINDGTIENQSKVIDTLVFLVFRMHKDASGKNSLELISKTEKEGKMKEQTAISADTENYLTIDLYHDNGVFKTIVQEHPLFKHVEYTDDSNQFISKNIEVEQDEFFFRIQKSAKYIQIKISETLKNKPKKELIALKI